MELVEDAWNIAQLMMVYLQIISTIWDAWIILILLNNALEITLRKTPQLNLKYILISSLYSAKK